MNNNYKSIDGIMKEIFNEFPSAVSKAVREDVLHYPPVNIIDKAAGYSVELSVPGYIKADFSIKLDNNVLTVSTEKKEQNILESEKFIRTEFALKSFKRSFTLNEKIDTENIAARAKKQGGNRWATENVAPPHEGSRNGRVKQENSKILMPACRSDPDRSLI